MGYKREREYDYDGTRTFSKRPKINPDLIQVWESLADDDEDTRLAAAYDVISNHFANGDMETVQTILKRLFRGLCSTRKCARPGFYVALVGVLSETQKQSSSVKLSVSQALPLLDSQTTAEAETSKQDERDHYFGRLLGVKAIVDSGMLSQCSDANWISVLSIIFGLMAQKSWLRAEASAVVCSYIRTSAKQKDVDLTSIILSTLKQLKKHRLVRTIDGLSIWLTAQEYLSSSKLPQDSWKSGNPLHASELKNLKHTLLDKKIGQVVDEDEDMMGKSVWSPKLSIVWRQVFDRIGSDEVKGEVLFDDFWQDIVEQGLFYPSSTPERKLIGFLVLETALEEVDASHISTCFSKNLMACQIHVLQKPQEAYLHKLITATLDNIKILFSKQRIEHVDHLIKGMLIGTGLTDYDTLTRTKFVQSLFDLTSISLRSGIVKELLTWFCDPHKAVPSISNVSTVRKQMLIVLQRAISSHIHTIYNKTYPSKGRVEQKESLQSINDVLEHLLLLRRNSQNTKIFDSPLDEATNSVLSDQISSILEALIPSGLQGRLSFLTVIASLRDLPSEMEEEIADLHKICWRHFDHFTAEARKQTFGNSGDSTARKMTPALGLSLMLGIVLFEVNNGDTDAAETLEEVNDMADSFKAAETSKLADQIVDFIMALVSKPSKLNRRIGNLVFEAFTYAMSSDGLEALVEVITTKETREGQQTLFEHDGDDLEDESASKEASDSEISVESDVEIIDTQNGGDVDSDVEVLVATDSEDSTSETSSNSDPESIEDNAELTSFESALAAALGTRKLNDTDMDGTSTPSDDSGSDSDMQDSEMFDLDQKLAEVFANQQEVASAQQLRKKESKNAKENVIILKNRALELIEIFLRTQQLRGLECVKLVDAVLDMARITATPQLAKRGLDMVKAYTSKMKKSKMPVVDDSQDTRDQLRMHLDRLYNAIEDESVTNYFLEVVSQFHILLCKLLLKAGEKNVTFIGREKTKAMTSRGSLGRKALQDFWARFEVWANGVSQLVGGISKGSSSNENGEQKHEVKSAGTGLKRRKKLPKQ